MLRILLTTFCLSCYIAKGADAQASYKEMRELWDMTMFPFDSLSQSDAPWFVLKITPVAVQPPATGVYIDADTGKLVVEPGKSIGITVAGQIHEIARFDGADLSLTNATYSWNTSVFSRSKESGMLLYSPFISGGAILSKFWGVAETEATFKPYYVIDEGWVEGLRSYKATKLAQGNNFMKHDTAQGRQNLATYLSGTNPIMALQAFRLLRTNAGTNSGSSAVTPLGVGDLIRSSVPASRSLLLVDLLRAADSVPNTEDEVRKLVFSAKNLNELRTIAVATRTILNFGYGSNVKLSKEIGRRIMEDCATAETKLQGDPEIKKEIEKIIKL